MAFLDEKPEAQAPPPTEEEIPFEDPIRAIAAAGMHYLGSGGSTVRKIAEDRGWDNLAKLSKGLATKADITEENLIKGITPQGRRAYEAKFFAEGDEPSVWDSPANSMVMKIAGTIPATGAAALAGRAGGPVGLVAEGMRSAQAENLDELYARIDQVPESDLIKLKTYAVLRKNFSQEDARVKLVRMAVKESNIGSASLVSGLANLIGAESLLAGAGLTKAIGRGLTKPLAVGGEELVASGAQGAAANIPKQQAEIATGEREKFDPRETIDVTVRDALEGAFIGTGIGAATINPGNLIPKRAPKEVVSDEAAAAIEASETEPQTEQTINADTIVEAVQAEAQQAAQAPQPAPAAVAPVVAAPQPAPVAPPAVVTPTVPTEDEFVNNADLPDDEEVENLTDEPPPLVTPEVTNVDVPAASAPSSDLPITPVVAEPAVQPEPVVEAPKPVAKPEPKPEAKKPEPKFNAPEEPKKPRILVDQIAAKAKAEAEAKATKAAATSAKRQKPKGAIAEADTRKSKLGVFERAMASGKTADLTGARPKIVADLVELREAEPDKGKKIKINNAILTQMKAEVADQKVADEAAAVKAKEAIDPETEVMRIADEFSAPPAETRTGKVGFIAARRRLVRINKAFTEAGIKDDAHPFVAGARGLLAKAAREGGEITAADIAELNKLQDSAARNFKPKVDKTVQKEAAPREAGESVSPDTVRGIESEGAASGEKLTPQAKAKMIAERNKELKAVGSKIPDRGMRPVFSGRFDEANFARIKGFDNKWHSVAPLGKTKVGKLLTKAQYEMTAAEYLSDKTRDVVVADASVLREISKRIANLVSGVDVYLVSQKTMDRLDPGSSGLAGYYHPGTDQIIISARTLENGSFDHAVLHEAAHAAYLHYLHGNPREMKDLTELYEYVRDNHKQVFIDELNEYSMTNPDEFLSEALSNPRVQLLLSEITIPLELAAKLGVLAPRKNSVLHALFGMISRALGITHTSAFDGVLAVMDNIQDAFNQEAVELSRQQPSAMALRTPKVPKFTDAKDLLLKSRVYLMAASQIGQVSDRYFGGAANNPLRKAIDWVEKRRVARAKYVDEGDKIVRHMLEAARTYPAEWEGFTTLMHDATMANTNPDVPITDPRNAHHGKDATKGWQAKARHAELSKRWDALPTGLKMMWKASGQFYADRQNRMSLMLIENMVEHVLEKADKAMAKRIHEGTAVDADWALFRTNAAMEAINNAVELKKIDGFYAPLIRHGDHVVIATYDINAENLMGGKVIGADVVQFLDPTPGKKGGKTKVRAMAKAYVEQSDLKHMGTQRLFVDPKDPTKRVPDDDPNGVAAYRVRMQTQHVEFHDSASAAEEAREALQKQKGIKDVSGVLPRKDSTGGASPDMLSATFKSLANKLQKDGKALDPQLSQAMREMAIRVLGSTRVQSRRLPRRYVAGASKDATRNAVTYNLSSAGYLAKLETQPEIDKHLVEANAYEKAHRTEPSARTKPRGQMLNEITKRINDLNAQDDNRLLTKAADVLLNVVQLDKLGSTSYHLINATQTVMVTAPVMAGRHGWPRVSRALNDAFKLVGAANIIGSGFRDFGKVAKSEAGNLLRYFSKGTSADAPAEMTKQFENVRARLGRAPNGKHLLKLMDEMEILVSPDANFEVGMLVAGRNVEGGRFKRGVAAAGTILHRTNLLVRQIGQAVETMNRTMAAVAAFNLEYERNGKDVDAAILYAKDIVDNTHFNYSQTNAPAIMADKHPIGRIALQFKKYTQGMTFLMVKLGHAVISSESSPEVRREAFKSLAYVMGTTAAAAGVLGLPTEAFKIGVMLLGAIGLIDDDWEDVERWVEDHFGSVIAHGLPNLAGVDVSTRMGLNNALLYGQPGGENRSDTEAWLFNLVGGAVGGYGIDIKMALPLLTQAAGNYLTGNFAEGAKDTITFAEKVIPMRQLADSVAAYKMATEGKVNKRGETVMEPSIPRAGLKFLGFRSRQEAESSRAVRNMYADKVARDAVRQSFFTRWRTATPDEKKQIWTEVVAFNKTVPKEARIERGRLIAGAKRSATAKTKKVKGVYLGQDQDLAQ